MAENSQLLFNTSVKFNDNSLFDSPHPSNKSRRGMLDENIYSSSEFTVQQKRYLENRLEKELTDKMELTENLTNLQREFSRYKDIAVQKQGELSEENEKLKQNLYQLQSRVNELESQKLGYIKSIDQLEVLLEKQRNSISHNDKLYRSHLSKLEQHERESRQLSQKCYESIEQRHLNMVSKYDFLVDRIVKLVFTNYTDKINNPQNNKEKNCKEEECKNIRDIMSKGILLPPCRKKPSNLSLSEKNQEILSEIKQKKQINRSSTVPESVTFNNSVYANSPSSTSSKTHKSLII